MHCANTDDSDKLPGKKNYLQCGSGRNFGYILHGLWPQGKKDKKGGYPRACEGDQEKIERKILEKYLCMTPSVWLLQHEFEYHGTCMHDKALETPINYFGKALELHSRLKLPKEKLPNNGESYKWFVENNSHLTRESIQYYSGGEEWQICYDNQFNVMGCPNRSR
jgi:ribonuclease T2